MNEATLNVSLLQEKQEAKERLQEMLLASLSKTDFFSKAAFYGGNAARIFYDLPRFSEDLDFSLLQKNPSFTFEPYFPTIQRVCQKLGVDVELSEKKKTQTTSTKSAFLKANTYRVLSFYFPSSEKALVHPDEAIRIKFETDDDPPLGGATEFRMLSSPFPSFVRVYSLPSLFAGKLSALLCREYGNRVKGRDYFDYLYYIGKGVSVDLPFLSSRLDRKSTRLNSSHTVISYAVFCLKK